MSGSETGAVNPGKSSAHQIALPLSQSLSCKLCLGLYQQPKLLSCLHSFCTSCLQKYCSENSVSTELECPTCREETRLPPGGVDDLVENSLLVNKIKRNIELFNATIGAHDDEPGEGICSELLDPSVSDFSVREVLHGETTFLEHDIAEGSIPSARRRPPTRQQILAKTRLRVLLSRLQNEAINIVYAIDTLNDESQNIQKTKAKRKNLIQARSRAIIDAVKRRERQLLNELENMECDRALQEEIASGKKKLQHDIRKLLSVVDFVRLLVDAEYDVELENFFGLISNRVDSLARDNIKLEKKTIVFDSPKTDIDNRVSELLGEFHAKNEEVLIWEMPRGVLFESSDYTGGEEHVFSSNQYEESCAECTITHDVHTMKGSISQDFEQKPEVEEAKRRVSIAGCSPLTIKRKPIRLSHSFDINLRVGESDEAVAVPSEEYTGTEKMTSIAEGGGVKNSGWEEQSQGRKYQWRRSNRRHTVSDIQREIADNDEKWNTLFPATPADRSRSRVRHMSEDLHRTRQMINICKRQIAEAKTRAIPAMTERGGAESDVITRDRFLQLRESVKNKTARWRRMSVESNY